MPVWHTPESSVGLASCALRRLTRVNPTPDPSSKTSSIDIRICRSRRSGGRKGFASPPARGKLRGVPLRRVRIRPHPNFPPQQGKGPDLSPSPAPGRFRGFPCHCWYGATPRRLTELRLTAMGSFTDAPVLLARWGPRPAQARHHSYDALAERRPEPVHAASICEGVVLSHPPTFDWCILSVTSSRRPGRCESGVDTSPGS